MKEKNKGLTRLTDYLGQTSESFTPNDKKQHKIRAALVSLIVKGSLPMSIGDNPAFIDFVKTCEPRYLPVSRFVYLLCYLNNVFQQIYY